MSNTRSGLHRSIMRRVYAMYVARLLASPRTAVIAGVFISLFFLKTFVFVRAVFDNMPALRDVPAFVSFWSSAVMNTEMTVRLVLLSLLVFCAIGALHIVQLFRLRQASFDSVLQ
jgi:hypothetical protein